MTRLNQHEAPAAMSDDQFETLVEMLRPGYELSTLMLADYKAHMAARNDKPEPVAPVEPVEQEPLDFGGGDEVLPVGDPEPQPFSGAAPPPAPTVE